MTSIGTEENSLGVLRAHSRALIYMRVANTVKETQYKYKGDMSQLSKYSYIKGDSHQEDAD